MNLDKTRDVIKGNIDDLIAEIETKNDIIDDLNKEIRELETIIEEKDDEIQKIIQEKDDEIQKLKVEIEVFTFLENKK